MKGEIKEILDLLNFNRDTISNGICRVEDFMSREQIIKLLDYITNLQDRTKELEAINEEHRRINGELRKTINEAIEYNKKVLTWYTNEEITDEITKHNLSILKGSDK